MGSAIPGFLLADQWQIITDRRDVRDLVWSEGRVWCATSGGLAAFDPQSREFKTYTPLDGLDGIGVRRLAVAEDGGLWLGFDNRAVQYFHFRTGRRYSVPALKADSKINLINDVAVSPRGVFVATNIGVARLVYVPEFDRWVWLERYTRLGPLPPETEVRAVAVQDSFLWAATQSGLGRGNLNTPLPLVWTLFTRSSGLPGDTVLDVVSAGGRVYASTNEGIAVWDGVSWQRMPGIRGVPRLEYLADTIRAVGRSAVFTWTGTNWAQSHRTANWPSSVTVDDTGSVWAGLIRNAASAGGLATWMDTSEVNFIPPGPTTNYAYDFNFTADGDLILVGGGQSGEYGLSLWDGSAWKTWSLPTFSANVFSYQHRSVVPDRDGGIWVGTFGGGIAHYRSDGTFIVYDHTPETGSRLQGYDSTPRGSNYVIAAALDIDGKGNLWVANRQAADGRVLVCVPRSFIQDPSEEREWVYFHRSLFNNYDLFEVLVVDGRGRVWLASFDPTPIDGQGVYVFDHRGTLDNPADDRVWGPIAGLNSPQVNSLAWDPDGYVWAGSIDGAYYVRADTDNPGAESFQQVYPLRQQAVNAVAVDFAGNKWFGTNDGVMVLDRDLFTVRRLITSSLPDYLPEAPVRSIGVSPVTGWAYIGTTLGTVALQTPYRNFGERLVSLVVDQNPFNPNRGRLLFLGSSLAGGASAKVLTLDGRVVRTLSHEEAALGWDGNDAEGRPIADGVYYLVTYNAAGQTARTKVAVLRR